MTSPATQIGFDRFIQLEWAAVAANVRAELAQLDDVDKLLDTAGLGIAARKKTRTVLNRLWLEPRPKLAAFADRGIATFKADPSISVAALSWGMAIATYPFFGKVAELVGRLSALQGDCASAEVHRRMSEIYGEREGTYRMTNMVLQTQVSWGAIERVDKGKRLVRKPPMVINQAKAVAWLLEAALRYVGKSVAVSRMQSLSVMYPFVFHQPLAYIVSKSVNLEVRSEGEGSQFVYVSQQ